MTEILRGKTLLIVEDEADLREPLATEFQSLGCQVFQAGSGRTALEILRREKIDAVISDVRMPGGDGIDLLKSIKESNHNFPVIMLITGHSDFSKADAYHLGAEAILSKPFDLDDIDAAVVKILTPREQQWSAPPSDPVAKTLVEKTFSSVRAAAENGYLGLGRGGIFLKQSESQASSGQNVRFNIHFETGEIRRLDGTGIVRWARTREEGGLPSGMGIEFESLGETARREVLVLTEALKTKPFIPKLASPLVPTRVADIVDISVASDPNDLMLLAIEAARKAEAHGDVPVGAVLWTGGKVVAISYNSREFAQTALGHAEVDLIRAYNLHTHSWRLPADAVIAVTAEPCLMCTGALLQARVSKVIYGCKDTKNAGMRLIEEKMRDGVFDHRFEVVPAILEKECAELLSSFFQKKRQGKTS